MCTSRLRYTGEKLVKLFLFPVLAFTLTAVALAGEVPPGGRARAALQVRDFAAVQLHRGQLTGVLVPQVRSKSTQWSASRWGLGP